MPDCTVHINAVPVTVPAEATVAAALVRAGCLHTRTSLTGGPRFAFCGMGQCGECRVTIDGNAHQLACQVLVKDGMQIDTGSAA
ncbi:MAG: 2Fe-2S iron-sulfur cluster-binding protein [Telluria sp.]